MPDKKKMQMKFTPEQIEQINKLKAGIDCPKGFSCVGASLPDNICKIKRLGEDLLECTEPAQDMCRFSVSFGMSRFCICPLRKYIADNLEN